MAESFKRKVLYRYLIIVFATIIALVGSVMVAHNRVQSFERLIVNDQSEISEQHVTAIVFGSAVDDIAKEPRPIVRKRLEAALELYRSESIDSIVVSGFEDTVNNDYNEPDVMKRFLVTEGVPAADIIEDAHGDSSYDTCLNARNEFNLESAVLVTQFTHLPRALYLCESMGIDVVGYSAPASPSRAWLAVQLSREALSNVKAIFDIHIRYNLIR